MPGGTSSTSTSDRDSHGPSASDSARDKGSASDTPRERMVANANFDANATPGLLSAMREGAHEAAAEVPSARDEVALLR